MDPKEDPPLMTLMLDWERQINPQNPAMKKTAERFAADARARMQLETEKKRWAAEMLEQSYDCPYATLIVKRNLGKITTSWQFKDCVSNPDDWGATAAIRKIEYAPDPNAPAPEAFNQKVGNGTFAWTAPEGYCYSGLIIFHDEAAYRNGLDARIAPIYFNYAVPLSYSKRLALERGGSGANAAATDIPKRLTEFMEKRELYDATMRENIGIIKSKGLSAEDEQQEIADLQDYGKWLKDHEGI